MYCSKCGTEVENTDKYCPKCGSALRNEPASSVYTNRPYQSDIYGGSGSASNCTIGEMPALYTAAGLLGTLLTTGVLYNMVLSLLNLAAGSPAAAAVGGCGTFFIGLFFYGFARHVSNRALPGIFLLLFSAVSAIITFVLFKAFTAGNSFTYAEIGTLSSASTVISWIVLLLKVTCLIILSKKCAEHSLRTLQVSAAVYISVLIFKAFMPYLMSISSAVYSSILIYADIAYALAAFSFCLILARSGDKLQNAN